MSGIGYGGQHFRNTVIIFGGVAGLFRYERKPWNSYVRSFKEKIRACFGDYLHSYVYCDVCWNFLSGEIKMDDTLVLKNNLKEVRTEKSMSQQQLADMVGVSRNTISSIETGQFNPTAKLALILCIALDKKFEELFYF